MPAFFEYLRNITYYLMFAAVVGIFVPSGRYRKFVSLVLGLVLLLMMIQPLGVFVRERDIPVTEWFAGVNMNEFAGGQQDDSFYAEWWAEYLGGAFEAQLEVQLERLLSDGGYSLLSSEFSYSDELQITSVRVSVSKRTEAEQTSGRVPFIRIEPPSVSPIQIGGTDSSECPDTEAVKTLISQFYNLPKSHIYVNVSF